MNAPLSALIADGLDGSTVAFGPDATPVSASELTECGAARFSADASAATVGLLMTNDRPTVETLLGAVAAGASVVSLPVPGRGADPASYAELLTSVCHTQGIDEVVASDEIARSARSWDLPGVTFRSHTELDKHPLAAPARGGFRLVQFSSGSTSRPKPVVLDDAALGANVAAILATIQVRPGDVAVSWLPLAHDMGLVGLLLTAVAAAGPRWAGRLPLVLLDPAAFLRRPSLWPEVLSHSKGSITASPDFGYRMATQRRPTGPVDLSALRCAIVGGEIVRAGTLAAFTGAYRHEGFDETALCPAYGMAELGLAATMTPLDDCWRSWTLATRALADHQIAAPQPHEPSVTLVGSGPPIAGYEIRSDADDGSVGRLAIRGPSTGLDGRTGTSYADPEGWFVTDDAGFLADGWIYVCGRLDDHIVTHGRNLYAPAIEAAVGSLDGVRTGRVTAVGLPDGNWAIATEPAADEPLDDSRSKAVEQEVRRAAVQVSRAQPDQVVVVPRGSLPLTASGKLQRKEVRRLLLRGSLGNPDQSEAT